ncbi:MAG TPA: response regulator, partial [Pirellulaceae bacterium]|nr:response regulator [Pirellulaceae bacterium]
AQERGLMLEYFWKSEIPESMQTDPARLRQILMNLVGNAIKFTEVGSVQVAARLQTGDMPKLVIDVLDTGVGIDAEAVEQIFDPFVQADSSITRRFGGTGLGLSISRRLARLLGGDLTVNSGLGRGSIFTLTIPTGSLEGVRLAHGAAADVVPSRSKLDQRTLLALPPCRILLVEDGVTNRKLISLILERAGASIRSAENGQAGLEAFAWEAFDLILMDMQMPVMDGYTATRELRRRGYTRPIIALTAHAMASDERKCREAGCSGYMTKPIDPQQLLEVVARALREQNPGVEVDENEADDIVPIVSRLSTDDRDFCEIINEFAGQLEKKLTALRSAAAAEDLPRIAEIAHWIRGAGGTAGFDQLTQPAAALEKFAKEGRLDGVEPLVRRLESLFARIQLPIAG